MARIKFASENFYHVYNRGTEKRKIFLDDSDYWRFLISMRLMNDEKDGLMIQWRDYKITNPDANLETFLRCHLRERKPLVEANFRKGDKRVYEENRNSPHNVFQ